MYRRKFAALIASVGAAGCLRLTGSGSPTAAVGGDSPTGEADSAPSPTPAETREDPGDETDPPLPTQADYPLGLSDDGLDVLLWDTHQRALAGTNYHTAFQRIDVGEGTVERSLQYDVEPGRALGSWVFERGGPVNMFRSNEGAFWREDLGSAETYGTDSYPYSVDVVTWSDWIEPVIRAGEWSAPTVVQERAPTIWQVETDGVDQSSSLPGWLVGEFERLDAVLKVDHRGIIHSVDAEFEDGEAGGDHTHQRLVYGVDSIGDVTVAEPAWVPTARENRPRVTATFVEDRAFVEFTIDSGNAIEPETNVHMFDLENLVTPIGYRISQPIEPGETVYFYREQEGQYRGQIARGSPPADASPLPLESRYQLFALRGVARYFGWYEFG